MFPLRFGFVKNSAYFDSSPPAVQYKFILLTSVIEGQYAEYQSALRKDSAKLHTDSLLSTRSAHS